MLQNNHPIIVQEEQLAQLLLFNGKTGASNSFLAVLLAYVQSDVLPVWLVLTWLFAVVLVNVVRFFISRHYLKHPVDTPTFIRKRLNVFRVGVAVSACVWCASSFLVQSDHLYEQQLFVAYLLAGLSAGSAIVYSIDLMCALAFTVISLLPMFVLFMLSGDDFLVVMAITGFTYAAFISVSLQLFNRKLVEGILLRVEAVKSAEEVRQLAFYDVLTGLPNRRLLLERLERAFVQGWRTGKRGAILFIDLDHFKKLNDTLGHDMGDMLLKQVAERLKKCVRESDTVSRFGGDEFVLLLENLNEHAQVALQEIEQLTALMLAKLNQPYQLSDVDFDYMSTPSIGVAMLGLHGRTQQELLKHADIAMYHAKKSGRNQVGIYNAHMQASVDIE